MKQPHDNADFGRADMVGGQELSTEKSQGGERRSSVNTEDH